LKPISVDRYQQTSQPPANNARRTLTDEDACSPDKSVCMPGCKGRIPSLPPLRTGPLPRRAIAFLSSIQCGENRLTTRHNKAQTQVADNKPHPTNPLDNPLPQSRSRIAPRRALCGALALLYAAYANRLPRQGLELAGFSELRSS
jgi:hypothetical protein